MAHFGWPASLIALDNWPPKLNNPCGLCLSLLCGIGHDLDPIQTSPL